MPRILGPIIRLQVQRSRLKTGEKPNRRYDPAPIVSVDRLRVSPEGAVGTLDGREYVDVHHRAHPATRNDRPEKGLSVGFTGHYAEMQERYGNHMTVGCAGENIIVDLNRRIPLSEVEAGLVILAPDGRERVRLKQVCVARPCKPFSGFAHRQQTVEPETLKATLQFLDDGLRGFRCVPDVAGEIEIEVGDLVAVV
ncbi:MAG: hypothetical protein HY700_15340 [Gemmatimonadetes bacterium]|nr:hypothetical protein [Gemmatimonadota bacterium]